MSLPLSEVVELTVNLSNPGLSRQGFGTLMLLSNTGNAWATPELTRRYSKGGYATDFPSGTLENAIMTATFSQPAPPRIIVVGKGSRKPTMVKTLTVDSAVSGALYEVNVWVDGTLWVGKYTAGGGDSVTDIAEALVDVLSPDAWSAGAAYVVGDRVTNDTGGKIYECITAGTADLYGTGPIGTTADFTDGTAHWKYIVTPNFTAVNALGVITFTGKAAGNWYAIEPLATGDQAAVSNVMSLIDTTTDPSGHISADLDTIVGADSDWYALVVAFKSKAILSTSSTGVAAWCEANGKLLVASVSDTACATAAYSGATDVLHALTAAGGSYTAPEWHPRDYEFQDACVAGYFLPIEPGSDNWRMKVLVGPTPVNLTTTQVTNLNARRAGYVTTLGAQNVLAGGGNVESTVYGFIDTRRNLDWYASNLQIDLVNLEVQSNKLPNTTAGRRKIANAIAARNDIGIQKGVISPDPYDPTNAQAPIMEPYTVTVPPVTDTSSFDATTRELSGVSTAWKLASPINKLSVVVNVVQ